MVALPYVLYQAWAFVAPGLYEHEKKFALPIVVASTVLFLLGVAFCYYFVFGKVFTFINDFAPKSITPAPDIEAYFSFVITMFLAFGVTFEIPIVVILLVRFGVVGVDKLKEARPYVIVGAFVVAAVVTPPDVLSQLMLAVPMCLLYEAGLFFARFVGTRAKAAEPEQSLSGVRWRPSKHPSCWSNHETEVRRRTGARIDRRAAHARERPGGGRQQLQFRLREAQGRHRPRQEARQGLPRRQIKSGSEPDFRRKGKSGSDPDSHRPFRKRSTSANCSGTLSAGAWPQPGMVTTTARGPRERIASAVSGSSRSEFSPRRHSVGMSSAS